MFTSARLKLTAWYLLIIMIISISFSVVVYRVLTYELNRVIRMEKMREEGLWVPKKGMPLIFDYDDKLQQFVVTPYSEVIEEAKNRLKLILVLINGAIFIISGAAGYFLAGRTLKPIQLMVDEQNRFITDASHELRTPLTSLKSEIEVNLRDKKLTLVDAKKLLQSNLEEVNNLQYLSDNLIKLAQNHKRGEINVFTRVWLEEVITEAVKKVSKIAKRKQISILSEGNNQIIKGEKQTLIELFVILLDNAIKYSNSKTKIVIRAKKKDQFIKVDVVDEGVGIEANDIPYLFDRFYRSDKSRSKTDISGYGLGLSIAKQIIDKHNGFIKVESRVGKGSTFSIFLPKTQ